MPMWFWFFHVVCTFLRFIVHCALALRYWGKGEKVPKVKNPLLLKSAAKLAEEIREGKIKSENVIRAYMERILEVEPYINATVDQCFSAALEEAKEVDVLIASGRYSKKQLAEEKPLLGVPISVKVLLIVKVVLSSKKEHLSVIPVPVGLVPNLGCHPTPDPTLLPYLYTGPMCRYAEDLIISMRILSSQSGVPVNFGQKLPHPFLGREFDPPLNLPPVTMVLRLIISRGPFQHRQP
ncbi:fatty-acid amide hydrolase 2-A, partial [Trichonephila inaurata madagascariensis]